MANISLSCWQDLANFFSRSQNYLDREFAKIDTIRGVWEGRVKSAGTFPHSTGFAARRTILGQQRINQTTIDFKPMVGHQDDCLASCNANPQQRVFQAVDHRWYRVMNHSEYTPPFCLKTMWQEAFELEQQVAQQFEMLKRVTNDIDDEFSRQGVVQNSDNHWVAVDDGTNDPKIMKTINGNQSWRFAADANGTPNVNKIILDASYTPSQVGYLTVETLNRVRVNGMYNGAFDPAQMIDVVSDLETFDYMVKLDSNQRMDNRWRQPDLLNPQYGNVKQYANYGCIEDPFQLRYFWDTSDHNYPGGVLTRIDPWASKTVSEGCFSEASERYIRADFAIHIPWNGKQCMYQTMDYPTSLPGQSYNQPFAPYAGTWMFQNNKSDQITPCNLEQNLGYWYMVWEKAMMPYLPQLGHDRAGAAPVHRWRD